jgi:DNA-binding beta-propeller fold protein YncE
MKMLIAALALLLANGAFAQAMIQPLSGILEGHHVGGVSIDKIGDLYVADFGDLVWKITPDGQRTIFATGFYGSSGNVVDAEGNLLQASYYGNYITRIDRAGHEERLAAGALDGPVGLAVEPKSGDLYVANCGGNFISRIKPDGTSGIFARDELLKCPNSLAFGPDGTLYAVNYRDNHMLKIDANGLVAPFVTISAKGLGHLCFRKDRFFVTAFASHELYQVTLAGAVTRLLGNGQRGVVNGKGERARLSFPNGIACDPWASRLYIDEYVGETEERLPPRAIIREVVLPE